MKIIEPLIHELKDTLKEFDIEEDIDFKISNIEGFDYQINNLVTVSYTHLTLPTICSV